jgi:23S rRNA (uracil1939-C5)-methyltransferase
VTLKPGDIIRVRIETLSSSGDGIAFHGGNEIHVLGLLPGETADVTVEHVNRRNRRVIASSLSLITDHAGRRRPPCSHHRACSGCALMDLNLEGQREAKVGLLRQRYGLSVDRIVNGDSGGMQYRWSSKRVVGGVRGQVALGSYRRGTHLIAKMDGCLVDHPDIVSSSLELRTKADELELEPYDERVGTGDLRYVWFKTNGRGDLLLTLITAEPRSRAARELADQLELPSGIAWGVQSAGGNAIRGATVRPLRGKQSLRMEVAGVPFEVGPLGFLQPNPEVAGLAYLDLVRVPAGGRTRGRLALDLYAGVGVTTALLREQFERVLPCEAYPESARLLGVEPELAESFLARILATPRAANDAVDLVVANPPRGGLGPTICGQLNQLRAPRVHIMSCQPRSLAQDVKRLTGSDGSYKLLRTRAYDTLPQTPHLEVVAWLIGRTH